MGTLQVVVLGTPHVRHGQAVLALPTRKALALLIYLAVEGGVHQRGKLAALFWPDIDQQHARAMLRYTLTAIRRVVGDSTHFTVEGEALGIDASAGIELDLDVLRAARALCLSGSIAELRKAVDCCRGEFIEGFSLPDAQDFDEWTSLQRESCRRAMELALDRLSQLELDSGDLAAATITVERWLVVSPLNEEAHRRQMRVHFASGDRTAALHAYEEHRARLDWELHVPPSAETESLAERIRTSTEPPRALLNGWRGGALPPGPFEGPLVGRADEFARLVHLYQAAGGGQTQVVILRGEPGIGKTRLAREFLAWARGHGADVLQGRAFETGGRLPYQPLVDALRPRLEQENAPEDLLDDVWLTELGRLLPELRERYPDLPLAVADEAAARMRLFEAIARLGLAFGQRSPVVLFVDDIQWADAGSLDGLLYAARRWTDCQTPLMVLLSLRPEAIAVSPILDEWLSNGLPRAVSLTQLELGPLTPEDTRRFIQGLADRAEPAEIDELARWLHVETGGQPLFVVEMLRALIEREALVARPRVDGGWAFDLPDGTAKEAALDTTLPPGMREVIQGRVARLAPAAHELLVAGSVLGQRFTFQQLQQVAGLSEDEALSATDEVLRLHLVREVAIDNDRSAAGAYLFAHDKIRDVVYADAGDARRGVFHRRAFEALEGTAPAATLAHHALAAGLDEPAVRFGLAAGDEAVRLLAARDSIAHYERALEIAGRRGWTAQATVLHARCGKALASLARWVEARRELEAALDGLGADQLEQRGEVLIDLLEVCWWWLDVPALRLRAAEAVALAEDLGRADLKAAAVSWLVPTMAAVGDVAECIAEAERAFPRGRDLGFAPPPPVLAYVSIAYYWLGRIKEAVAQSDESVQAARIAKHTSATMFALPNLGLSLAASGRYAEAAQVFDEALRFGREYGIGTLSARALAISAGYHLDVFDFATNEALAEEARELARSLSFTPPVVSAGIDLLINFARRQEVARAEALIGEVAEAVQQASGWHGWLWKIRLGEARAEIALARGDWRDARRWSSVAIDESCARGRMKYRVLGLHTRAQALQALGHTRDAITDLQSAVALARPVGDPALFLRAATGLLAIDGDDALVAEAATTARRIACALPDARMRTCFETGLTQAMDRSKHCY